MKCDLPYVQTVKDRYGRWHYYFRRGRIRSKLAGSPGSVEFTTAYATACEKYRNPPPLVRQAPKPGTLKALCAQYFASAEFANLAKATQRETRYALEAICRTQNKDGSERGDNPVMLLERRHILGWRDKLKDKPGAANKMVRVIRVLLSFALNRAQIRENPASGIKMLKTGWYRDWTDAELEQFEAAWPLGTLERTGFALALYTAQRRADVASMRWTDIAGDCIRIRQQKTGTVITLPIHPALAEALAAISRKGETILTGNAGGALNPVYFGHIMASAIAKAGLPDECVLHGLRKTAARIVAETGGKVGALTGHLSGQMEREYSRRADQTENAKTAVLNWSRKRKV